ncbi:MAG: DUF3084 domain-containing protein [Negativicutes bacterium]|nr:DUF3084 domain-containing protein [Negativicutes bacterium]
MFGLRLILILAIVGGLIAWLGDWLGTKIGKKRLSLFGLRPRYTSILVAVSTGVCIAVLTIGIMALSSQEARTALFGLKKLETQMQMLKEETELQKKEIANAYEELNKKRQEIDLMEKELEVAQKELEAAGLSLESVRQEVTQLVAARAVLEQNRVELEEQVQKLNAMAEALGKNISEIREGTVIVRAGQVVNTGVFSGGQSESDIRNSLELFMKQTNQIVNQRYGGLLGGTQGLLLSDAAYEEAVAFLVQNQGVFAIRVQAAGNLFAGEPLWVTLDIFPNEKVYGVNDVIHQDTIRVSNSPEEQEAQVMDFLRQVNEAAILKGVRPDPIGGTVGAINLADVYETVSQMRQLGGEVILVARARQSIYTPGPVRLEIRVTHPL